MRVSADPGNNLTCGGLVEGSWRLFIWMSIDFFKHLLAALYPPPLPLSFGLDFKLS
jgi:hypothetical protein